MKKILAVFGLIALVFSLAACVPEKFTVTFDSNGGTNVPAVEVELDGKVAKPADPTKEGYIFVEWQLNGVKYEFETKVTKNITLKAKWNEKNVVDPEETDEEKLENAKETLMGLISDPSNIKSGFVVPTKFTDDIVATWFSANEDVVKVGEPGTDGFINVAVRRQSYDNGDAKVKLTATLTLNGKEVTWDVDLTVIALPEDTILSNKFGEVVTAENAGKTIVVEDVALYAPLGTSGYYLSTTDGVIVYINGQAGMPKAGKLYQATAEVDIYYSSLQLKDLNFFEISGTPNHVVEYKDITIDDVVKFDKPSSEHVYGHDTYKFKDVKIIVEGTGNYNTFLVDKDFKVGVDTRTKENSIMLYYTSQINELRSLQNLEIDEIDLVLEGYRTDHNIWYFSYLKPMEDIKLAELTEQEKADAAKNSLEVTMEFPTAGTITLLTAGLFDSTITWAYKDSEDPNNSLLDLVTGAVTLPAEPGRKIVKIVATITNGEATATKEFDIKVGEYVLEDVEDALLLEDGETIMIEGVITDKFANNSYGLQDETGAIAIYSSDNLELGRKYKLIGEKDTYNGLHQLKNIELVSDSSGLMPTAFSINDIIDNEEELENHIGRLISIEGAEVVSVGELSDNFRVVTLKVDDTEIIINYDKRVFDGEDSAVLAALEPEDIVNYVGILGWYKGPQLGFGPNTFIGEGWPQADFEFVTTIDFGNEDKSGYAAGELTFINGDGTSYTVNKDRAQIFSSTFDPHKENGELLVLAPIDTATFAFVEFDLGHLAGMNQISFEFAAWSPAAFTKASGLEDSVVSLQVWDGTAWVSLKDSKGRTNVIEDLTNLAYVKVVYSVEGPGKFRLIYDAPNAASKNTTQALVFDNFVIERSINIDFGNEDKSGYAAGELTFINGDGTSYTVNKDRAQIFSSTFDPHKENGELLVLAPIDTATFAFVEFDLGHLAGMNQISFEFAAWSPAAFTKASGLEDSVIALQVWDGTEWVSLKDSKGRTNVIEDLTNLAYVKVVYSVEGPGKFRLIYDAPNAASKNTTQALVFDNFVISGEKVAKEVEENISFIDLDFTKLAESTSYVVTPTDTVVNNEAGGSITLVRNNSNISKTGTTKGIVIALRKPNWDSAYLQTKEKINGVSKIEFEVYNWTTDAQYNLNFASKIVIQTSTDGETWIDVKDFKADWDTGNLALNTLTYEFSEPSDVYVRLFVETVGTQPDYQLRLIVSSMKVWLD